MPFVNGRYYANPFYGAALERARLRATGAEDAEPEVVSASEAENGDATGLRSTAATC